MSQPFKGLREEFKTRAACYKDDWTVVFEKGSKKKALSTILFMYFACLAPTGETNIVSLPYLLLLLLTYPTSLLLFSFAAASFGLLTFALLFSVFSHLLFTASTLLSNDSPHLRASSFLLCFFFSLLLLLLITSFLF
jgi:hypothetical protein